MKCGSCGLKFHIECMEKWIRNNGKCPRKGCQKSDFKNVIAELWNMIAWMILNL